MLSARPQWITSLSTVSLLQRRSRHLDIPHANFFASGVLALGDRLGPVLWQLPARATFDAGLLDEEGKRLLQAETNWLFSFAAAFAMTVLLCRVFGAMVVRYL